MDLKENMPLSNKDLEKVTGGYIGDGYVKDDGCVEGVDSDAQKDDEGFIPLEVVF